MTHGQERSTSFRFNEQRAHVPSENIEPPFQQDSLLFPATSLCGGSARALALLRDEQGDLSDGLCR
jgi:hypothetical protein